MRIHSGYEVKTEGDAFVVAFQSGINALRFCVAVQQQFVESDWPREILNSPVAAPVYNANGRHLYRGLSVRMGIHFGMTDDEEDKVARRMDYHGVHMIIAARVSALADGGQINITDTIRDMYLRTPEKDRPDIAMFDLGLTPLKGLPNPEHLYVVYPKPLADRHKMRSSSVSSSGLSQRGDSISSSHQLALPIVLEEHSPPLPSSPPPIATPLPPASPSLPPSGSSSV